VILVTELMRVGKKFSAEIRRLRNDYQFKYNHKVTIVDMSDMMVDFLHSKRRKKNAPFMEI
jgi:hypothetical protein